MRVDGAPYPEMVNQRGCPIHARLLAHVWGVLKTQGSCFAQMPHSSAARMDGAPGFGTVTACGDALEVLSEADFAFDRGLVGGDAALEEVGQLLHVLQFHEAEWVLRLEVRCDAEALQA